MTKTHFEAIAHTLDANHAPLSLVLDFADMCAESNPRFNRRLFVQAATKNLVKQQQHETIMLHNALTKGN